MLNSILNSASMYIDPAATSILLTSITTIVVAIGATFIVLWRKFKKGVSKTLHIDPNAGKEVEDDLVLKDENSEENMTASEMDAVDASEVQPAEVTEEKQEEISE